MNIDETLNLVEEKRKSNHLSMEKDDQFKMPYVDLDEKHEFK